MSDELLRSLERQALSGDAEALLKLKNVWRRTLSNQNGLLFAKTDEQINAAVEAGRRITTKLVYRDVILVIPGKEKWPVDGPCLAVVVGTAGRVSSSGTKSDCECIAIDYLDSKSVKNSEGILATTISNSFYVFTDDGDVVTVLKRDGKDVG